MTDHDFDHLFSHLEALEAAWLDTDPTVPRCRYCTTSAELLPVTGTAWGLDVSHEDHCPTHEDNLPTPTRPAPAEFPGVDS